MKKAITPLQKAEAALISIGKKPKKEIKIECGVPLPIKSLKHKSKYPFGEMNVDDSFFTEGKTVSRQSSIASAASFYCKKRGLDWKFTTRQVENGIRCWRIK